MKRSMIAVVGVMAVMLMTVGTANASMTLVQGTQPVGATTLFSAIGTFNWGNQKARLEASDPGVPASYGIPANTSVVQGGNPGNGWWDGDPRVERSWEVIWNNTSGAVTFNVYSTNDWTGTAAMSMVSAMSTIVPTKQTPVITAGMAFVGLNIGARLTSDTMSVTLGNVQFNDGSGFVSVPTADATYSGNAWFNNYHALSGTLGDFTLRGTTIFPAGTTTGDSMRFFVTGIQPEPATMGLLALGGVATLIRRRRGK